MTLTKPALIVAAVILAVAAAASYAMRGTAQTIYSLDTTIKNDETGLTVGVETDKHGNLLGVAYVGAAAQTPAQIVGGTLIVDGVRTPASQQPDGRWVATVPLWTGGRHDVRMEAIENSGALRYWEAKGVR